MGPNYTLEFMTVPYENSDLYKGGEAETLQLQREWLKDVTDGDDGWFADKFYEDPYYLRVKARDEARLQSTTDPRDRFDIVRLRTGSKLQSKDSATPCGRWQATGGNIKNLY